MNHFKMSYFLTSMILVIACCVSLAFISTPCALAASPQEDESVIMVARTLERLGENDLAKRFLDDYFNKELISFKDLGGNGINAETGLDGPARIL